MAASATYAPDFRIKINGQDIPAALRGSITSVRYEDGMQSSDRVEIGLANTNLRWLQTHIRGLGFQPFPSAIKIGPVIAAEAAPAGSFDIDNKLSLGMGYAPDSLEEMFLGEITGVEANFPSGGMPTMTLVAHDYLQRFNSGSYARGFGPLDDMLVAMMLSTENGLKAMVADPVIAGASAAIAAINQVYNGSGIKQAGESDFELLKRIAATYDADFWVDGETLYLSRLVKEYTPSATLTYGENLLDFAPHVSLVGQIAGVSARFTLREIPLDFYVTVGWDFDKETLSFTAVPGDATPSKDSASATFTIVDKPIRSPADIKNSALLLYRELRNKVNNRLTGHGSSIGDPRIRAGGVLRLEGLGPDFSGDYRVAGATHSIDGSGYRTNFEVRKEIIP